MTRNVNLFQFANLQKEDNTRVSDFRYSYIRSVTFRDNHITK